MMLTSLTTRQPHATDTTTPTPPPTPPPTPSKTPDPSNNYSNDQVDALHHDLLRTTRHAEDIITGHGATLDGFVRWLSKPMAIDIFRALAQIAELRARTVLSHATLEAAHALTNILQTDIGSPRHAETIRKAATTLIKLHTTYTRASDPQPPARRTTTVHIPPPPALADLEKTGDLNTARPSAIGPSSLDQFLNLLIAAADQAVSSSTSAPPVPQPHAADSPSHHSSETPIHSSPAYPPSESHGAIPLCPSARTAPHPPLSRSGTGSPSPKARPSSMTWWRSSSRAARRPQNSRHG